MPIIRPLLTAVVAVLFAGSLTAASRDLSAQARTKSLDPKYADPQLRTGTLPNGLRYFVRQNAVPTGRAVLRLVVDVGSVQEDDDQRGLAHFLEHMAFNGTKRFPKHRLIEYLESIGMIFGGDLNASTSYDETIYMLTVPAEPVILDTALMILEDWAQDMTLDPQEIELERGVVMEERRVRGGPRIERYKKHAPVLFGNRYAQRMPIGAGEIITTAPRSAFVRFYQDWYRPDLMTVIAVGDFDPANMEATIKERFGKIPKRTSPRQRPKVEVPSWNAPIASIAEDDVVQTWSANLVYPVAARDTGWSPEAVLRRVSAIVFYAVMNERLRVLARSEGSPIRSAEVSVMGLGRGKPAHAIQLAAEEPTTLELGIIAVRAELARFARDGVLPGELELVRTLLLEEATTLNSQAEHVPSGSLAEFYVQSALAYEIPPSMRAFTELILQFAPEVNPPELQALAKEIEGVNGWMIMADAPKNSSYGTLTTTMLLESVRSGEQHHLPPYRDTALARSLTSEALLTRKPATGRIVQRRTLADLGVTEWILSNGARVLLKPTPWKNDELTINAIAPGGISLASDAEYLNAAVASDILSDGGLGEYDAKTLARRIAGKVGQWQIRINKFASSAGVAGSPRHAESLFEVLHLAFTAPRVDKEVFDKWRKNARRNYPKGFEFQRDRALAQRHPRGRPVAGAAADSVDTTGILSFYKARYNDASQFTFVVVGDFHPDSLRPLIEQYIGGLPGSGTHTPLHARDLGIRPPTDVVRRVVVGDDTLSKTLIMFTAEAPYTPESRVAMQSLASILSRRLRVRLREDLGGTYGVGVSADAMMIPYSWEGLDVQFSSKPKRVDELQQAALAVIDTLVAGGITPEELTYTQRLLSRRHESQTQSNGYWTSLLMQVATRGRTFEDIASEEQELKTVTAESIHAAIQRVLKRDRYILVMELPVRLAPTERDELLSTQW